jgi:hypothetical protein
MELMLLVADHLEFPIGIVSLGLNDDFNSYKPKKFPEGL